MSVSLCVRVSTFSVCAKYWQIFTPAFCSRERGLGQSTQLQGQIVLPDARHSSPVCDVQIRMSLCGKRRVCGNSGGNVPVECVWYICSSVSPRQPCRPVMLTSH